MSTIAQKKVGGIVAENFRTAKVFTNYGIDFCCKGGITLEAACAKNGISLESITKELETEFNNPEEVHYSEFSLTQLIDYIISNHHHYVENSIPSLKAYLQKIAHVHGERHPDLHTIKDLFFAAAEALSAHLKKEELILFPYIKAMDEANSSHFHLSKPHFGHIENPIHMMEEDHDMEGERFRQISKLCNNYMTPSDGCQTYRVAFAMLKEFEEDLHTHIHLENNILFPKAIALYNQMNA